MVVINEDMKDQNYCYVIILGTIYLSILLDDSQILRNINAEYHKIPKALHTFSCHCGENIGRAIQKWDKRLRKMLNIKS